MKANFMPNYCRDLMQAKSLGWAEGKSGYARQKRMVWAVRVKSTALGIKARAQ
jgi:hypothetical protein